MQPAEISQQYEESHVWILCLQANNNNHFHVSLYLAVALLYNPIILRIYLT